MDSARASKALLQRLESLERAGVRQLPRLPVPASPIIHQTLPDAVETASPPSQSATSKQPPAGDSSQSGSSLPALSTAEAQSPGADHSTPMATSSDGKTRKLKVLQARVAACELCQELACSRTQTVFGVGNPNARLCFFGEAPGADEDRQGEPFVGRAGKLLNDIIQKGMGLERSDVYILNVLKCRPPGNRNPSREESDNCRDFFEEQLAIIEPDFICCLGSVAAQRLLETKQTIGRLRGQLHQYKGAQVVATYHPAYLLRNPSAKKSTWEDVQLLMAEMGLKSPERTD